MEDSFEHEELMGHVETLFPPTLVAANTDMRWSPQADGVITTFDQYLADITDSQDLFDFSDMEPSTTRESVRLTAGENQIVNVFTGRSSDSVATFSSRPSRPTPPLELDDSESDDDISIGTLQSTIQTHLEDHIARKLGAMEQSLLEAMKNIMKDGLPSTVQTSTSSESTTTLTNSQARNDSDLAMPPLTGGSTAGQGT